MTLPLLCSENNCDGDAIREIDIKGESMFTKRKYLMSIYVCARHFELERDKGEIHSVRLL